MIQLFHIIFYQPLFNLMIFFYNVLPGSDVGLATIALTITVKLVLYPLTRKSLASQRTLRQLQPKIKELQKKYKDQKEKLPQEMIKLYKQAKVNPFSSFFPTMLQLPFLIAIYRVFRNVLHPETFNILYPFINHPVSINHIAFGLFDLTQTNLALVFATGAVQYIQTRMLTHVKQPQIKGSKDERSLSAKNKKMMLITPVITIIIGLRLPSGLVLYWLTRSLLTIVQQYYVFRYKARELSNTIKESSTPDALFLKKNNTK